MTTSSSVTAKTEIARLAASALAYTEGVVAGRIIAGKWERLACQRHIDDLTRSADPDWPYRYDEYKGGRVCRFGEMLPHVKGKWAKRDPATRAAPKIKLEPWQCFIICSLFGWVHKATGLRRFRLASAYISRKNAKSTLAAIIGWWMFAKDDEPGAEVYCGATTQKQAMEVFRPAWQMGKKIPAMVEGLGVTLTGKTEPGPMIRMEDGSKFETVIGDPGDGASPHCAITDEYHEHATSAQFDTMWTGMGARSQPLALIISTAGSNLAGPCREDWKACEKILERATGFEDEAHFCIIFAADPEDDWTSEIALRKANPNWGVSVDPGKLIADQSKAKRDVRKQSTFKTKHLDIWTSAKTAYYDLHEWQSCERPGLSITDFVGQPCFLSADLASKHDLVAMIALFPVGDAYAVFGKYYLPRATVDLPENQHYRAWEDAGYITVTDGNITDIDALIADAAAMNGRHQVIEMPFDPNRAWGTFPRLQKEGLNVVEYRNTILTMSEPMKELRALAKAGRIQHNGDPVLGWAMSNVTGAEDKKENVYPNKEGAAQKIDPVISLLMALGRAMQQPVGGTGGFAFV